MTKWKFHHDSGVWVAQDGNLVEAICLGERHASTVDGKYFMDSHYMGSYADNWHGGPRGSLEDLVDWVRDAEFPGLHHLLWNAGSLRVENLPLLQARQKEKTS